MNATPQTPSTIWTMLSLVAAIALGGLTAISAPPSLIEDELD